MAKNLKLAIVPIPLKHRHPHLRKRSALLTKQDSHQNASNALEKMSPAPPFLNLESCGRCMNLFEAVI